MSSILGKISRNGKWQVQNFKGAFNAIGRVRYVCSEIRDNILYSDVPNFDFPKITIPELVYSLNKQWPDYIAIECAASGKKYTFKELRKKSKNLEKSLRKKLKLQPKDVIAILLPNVPEYAIATLGSLEAGLIVTTINPLYTPHEICRQLKDSSAKAIITLDLLHKQADESLKLLQKQLPILTIQTQPGAPTPQAAISFKEFTDNEVEIEDISTPDPDSLAILPYSSGTTGLPKGVELTHSNIVANLSQMFHPMSIITYVSTNNHQDIVPAVLPFFHIYGLVVILFHCLHVGAKTVSFPKFTPELYIKTLREQKPHVLFAVPPIILFLATHPTVKAEDVANVRHIVNGAAPLGVLDEERMVKKSQGKSHVVQGYGLTEASPVVSMAVPRLLGMKNLSGSVGKVMPGTQIKIINSEDPNGKPLGPNEQGEILVKGPQVMKGYHNKPEENRNTFQDDWLRTGDICRYNEDGLIYITDRMKELIKVKGFQVPPAELEEIIRDYPDVSDVGVIGVPHPKFGEVPRAYVMPKPNVKLDPKKLQEYVKSKVAEYKQLHGGVAVVDSIPKSASGKILRKDLKLQYEKGNK